MPTSIRLDPEIERRLDQLAAKTGRTKAFYIRELIHNGLQDLEDYYLAMQVSARVRAGKERTYSIKEVRSILEVESRNHKVGVKRSSKD